MESMFLCSNNKVAMPNVVRIRQMVLLFTNVKIASTIGDGR